MTTLTGVIHGNTIELKENPGLPEGATVEVQVTMATIGKRQPGEGFRRSAGAMADVWSDDDDRILNEIAQSRFDSVSRELPE